MSRELIDWENVDTVQDLIDMLSLYPKDDKVIFIETREDAHKFINYWAFDVAAIKGEDEWSVLNGN